ncbi:unnamed protein product [Didymodactylos carnosus]|uniref:Reverse transcriptase domain-containing protein n=1 Tax=Didymodactylos carnosus TaxID=1234261 RepID=A0A813W8L5_9BILA|nr:unnamed protein product [Didymodactylos carnosus]CAF0878217.1 unnamed protein product [Didymodactylos carnosus]CAF3635412.1 unnamed protein product [Didymodactylos carnosus]CAF3662313.1 unnamed protein product [Didymodactylos carnosus]
MRNPLLSLQNLSNIETLNVEQTIRNSYELADKLIEQLNTSNVLKKHDVFELDELSGNIGHHLKTKSKLADNSKMDNDNSSAIDSEFDLGDDNDDDDDEPKVDDGDERSYDSNDEDDNKPMKIRDKNSIYRRTNEITTKDPLPRIDEILVQLGESAYFTKLNFKAGYFQMPLHKADQPKTAFSTGDKHLQFTVMLQGIINGSLSFQRVINEILGPARWKYALEYIDVIIIYSKTGRSYDPFGILDTLDKANFSHT